MFCQEIQAYIFLAIIMINDGLSFTFHQIQHLKWTKKSLKGTKLLSIMKMYIKERKYGKIQNVKLESKRLVSTKISLKIKLIVGNIKNGRKENFLKCPKILNKGENVFMKP